MRGDPPAMLLLLLLQLLGRPASASPPCPAICACNDYGTVSCNNLNLTSLPAEPELSNVLELELQDNQISTSNLLHILKRPAYKNLKKLDVRNNYIHYISPDLFKGLDNLEFLVLSDNGLKIIQRYSLEKMPALKYLYLERNDLTGIPPLPASLEELDISENGNIEQLTDESFSGLPNLRKIFINDCSLYKVGDNTFRSQTQLVSLEMDKNQLYQVPNNLPSSLRTLSLQLNRIEELTSASTFQGLSRLSKLFLRENWIADVSPKVFQPLSGLRTLDMSFNRLDRLPDELPRTLTVLDFSSNQLSEIITAYHIRNKVNPFAEMKYLTRVSFSNNSIGTVLSETFSENPRLSVIDLSDNQLIRVPSIICSSSSLELNLDGNQIRTIAANIFQSCTNIRKLYINDNILTNIHDDALSELTRLRSLELRGNQISSLPFLSFDELTSLDVRYNSLREVSPAIYNLTGLLTLKLDSNQINEIEEGAFSGVPRLQMLHMAFNGITSLEFRLPRGLTELKLSHNRITAVTNQTTTFTHHPLLTTLDLSSNDIISISPNSFLQFPNLQDLYLDENQLKKLQLTLPPMIRHLSIANNTIRKLESGALTGIRNADFIDLSGNQIVLIEKDFFSSEEFKKRALSDMLSGLNHFELNLENNNVTSLSREVVAPILDNNIGLLVALDGNPIRCNCLWEWLADELPLQRLTVDGACQHPPQLFQRNIEQVNHRLLRCSAPVMRSESHNLQFFASVGSRVKMDCVADGDPQPFYTWAIYKPDGNDMITITHEENIDDYYVTNKGSLIINNVQQEDSKFQYTCLANNYVDYDTLSYRLLVSNQPGLPSRVEVWHTSTQVPPTYTETIANMAKDITSTRNFDELQYDLITSNEDLPWDDPAPADPTPSEPQRPVAGDQTPPVRPAADWKEPPSDQFSIADDDSRRQLRPPPAGGTFYLLVAVLCGVVAVGVVMVLSVTIYSLLRRKKSTAQMMVSMPVNGVHKCEKDPFAQNGTVLVDRRDPSEYMFLNHHETDCSAESPVHFCNGGGGPGCENISTNSNISPSESAAGSSAAGGPVNNNHPLHHRSYAGTPQSQVNCNPKKLPPGYSARRSYSDENFPPYKYSQMDPCANFGYVAEKPEMIEFCDRESMV